MVVKGINRTRVCRVVGVYFMPRGGGSPTGGCDALE